jgi:ADP-dependent NAD(P)H-hydrate dehydratase
MMENELSHDDDPEVRAILASQPPLPRLPERSVDSHKGSFGSALVVAGSVGMTGAAVLAGTAALRGGAGVVRLAVPDDCLPIVACHEPSYMTVPLPADEEGRIALSALARIVEWAENATVVALGPGLGRSAALEDLVGTLYQELPRPMIVDADGLNALAAEPEVLARPGGPRILTPHPGEFARLTGRRPEPEDRCALTLEMAHLWGAVVVLKGHRTCISDGRQIVVNTTGNPGMATAGAGDVLTGLIAALACQGLTPFNAARLGVYLHGLAGDLAAREIGQTCLIASDLLRYLPAAFNATGNE